MNIRRSRVMLAVVAIALFLLSALAARFLLFSETDLTVTGISGMETNDQISPTDGDTKDRQIRIIPDEDFPIAPTSFEFSSNKGATILTDYYFVEFTDGLSIELQKDVVERAGAGVSADLPEFGGLLVYTEEEGVAELLREHSNVIKVVRGASKYPYQNTSNEKGEFKDEGDPVSENPFNLVVIDDYVESREDRPSHGVIVGDIIEEAIGNADFEERNHAIQIPNGTKIIDAITTEHVIQIAADKVKPTIVNMSFGANLLLQDDLVQQQYIEEKNLIVVAAAGNDGELAEVPFGDRCVRYSSLCSIENTYAFTGTADPRTVFDSVTTVGSFHTIDGDDVPAPYTSGRYSPTDHPDFYALGTVQYNGEEISGTSLSSPRVAAAYAHILNESPLPGSYDYDNDGEWDGAEIKDRLRDDIADGKVQGIYDGRDVYEMLSQRLKDDGYVYSHATDEWVHTVTGDTIAAQSYRPDLIPGKALVAAGFDQGLGYIVTDPDNLMPAVEYGLVDGQPAEELGGEESSPPNLQTEPEPVLTQTDPEPETTPEVPSIEGGPNQNSSEPSTPGPKPEPNPSTVEPTDPSPRPSSGSSPGERQNPGSGQERGDGYYFDDEGTLVIEITESSGIFGGLVPCTNGPNDPCDACALITLADNILEFLIYLAVFVAVIVFTYAGFMFVTAGGNEGQITKAKGTFSAVAIGFIIVLASWLLVDTLLRLTTGEGVNRQVERICENTSNVGEKETPPQTPATEPEEDRPSDPVAGSERMSHDEALLMLNEADILVTSTAGPLAVRADCGDTVRCTSLEGVKRSTVDQALNIRKACPKCNIVGTGFVDSAMAHSDGEVSHGSGDKMDIDDSPDVTQFFLDNLTADGRRGGKYPGPRYKDSCGNEYVKEATHWDITVVAPCEL